jgi:tetratricopeptide (TPR) repeat protein
MKQDFSSYLSLSRLWRWFFLCGTVALIGGCNANSGGQNGLASSWNEVVQRAARAVAIGRAYDRSLLALRREDVEALQRHGATLQRAGGKTEATRFAIAAVQEAEQLDFQAQDARGELRESLRQQSAKYYRAALQMAPDFDAAHPQHLNSLGYFLAERGTTAEDFRQAERLTRRSVQEWDKLLQRPDLNEQTRAALEFSRATTRDSVAWALFRQGRLSEARQEQERAVAEALKVLPSLGYPASVMVEWYFHLGEIYRAMKLPELARRQYETALKLDPEDAASRAALQALDASDAPTSPASRPNKVDI